MKRKAESDLSEEEQPKEKKQNTAVAKFKAPLWYAYGFGVDSGKIEWRWYSQLQECGWHKNKTVYMENAAYAHFYEHLGFTCCLRPQTWCFAPEIEPVIFEFFFDSMFRGLAGIIAEYAEMAFPGEAAMLICEKDSWHESDICLIGDWNMEYIHDYRETKEAAWRLLRDRNRDRCKYCTNKLHVFHVPYPTTETVH